MSIDTSKCGQTDAGKDALTITRAELTRLTAIAEGVDDLVVRLGEVTTKLEELRQGYWDARAVMGFDNDGDPTPRAITSSFPALMASDAKSMRDDYDESLRESDRAESRLAAANALLRECVAGLGHVGYPESMAMFNGDHRRAENLHDEILEHLQGAGDEA